MIETTKDMISVWMGTSLKTSDEFNKYTDGMEDIVKVAKEKGINEGNSLYYYSNAIFYEENPGRLYNDLKFIGTFKDPRKKFR